MKIGWNFPDNNNGQIIGISEAGIETFKGRPIVSLAREICQNSLDARKSNKQPVRVEFSLNVVKASKIPEFDELKNAINLCKDFWTKNQNDKTVDFFNEAIEVANKEIIRVLKISDYNTTGLTGSRKKYNTPWQNLVKSIGVSDKSGSSGGSFGIGKSAPFVCSDLRTVVYSTLDCEGIKASQGVARLVSFENNNGHITQGVGYYGNTSDNSALEELTSIGSKNRTRVGTDVYIIGFTERYQWINDIIRATLDGFLISIINNDLIVKIDQYEINSQTLPIFIDQYKQSAELAYNYYQVLTSKDAVIFKEDFKGLGNVTLRVLLGSEFKRRVLVTRKNGMKIFDKDRISGAIYFSAVLILEDEQINAYFREMETPQHDNWQPERHSNPTQARKYRTELFRWVKNNIMEVGRETITDEVDAEGLGDYIPDESLIELEKENNNQTETLENKIKNIEITEVKNVLVKKGFQHFENTGAEGEIQVPGFYDEESEDGQAHIPDGDSNESSGGIGKLVNACEDKNSSTSITKTVSVKPINVRLYISDYEKRQYTLIFSPEESIEKAYIKLSVAGEQANIKIPVISAYPANITSIKLPVKGNKIFVGNMTKNNKIAINFEIDYEEACSMEVNLYGIKI